MQGSLSKPIQPKGVYQEPGILTVVVIRLKKNINYYIYKVNIVLLIYYNTSVKRPY